mgnify:CR=1 FL=1
MNPPFCIGIAGWKNSGKTSLVAGLVTELSNRGLGVSTIKHAHHAFDLDTPGTDSFKHREAGAREVILVSRNRWAIQHELRGNQEPDFETMIGRLDACDIVLVEGYKRESIPKLEIIGPESKDEYFWPNDSNVKAIACDEPVKNCPLRQFGRSDYKAIGDFLLDMANLKK